MEVVAVEREAVGVAVVADDLVAVAGDAAVDRRGPPALHRAPHHNHRAAVGGIPVFHGLQNAHHLVVIVAVVYGEHIPAVCGPLVFNAIAVVLRLYDAADEFVVDAGVVVRQQDAQALAYLLRYRLRLHLLRMP